MSIPSSSSSSPSSLSELRNQIDALDKAIGELISQRAECAQQVALVKTEQDSQGGTTDEDKSASKTFYRPEREAQVLRKAMERNSGPLSNEEMARLFREIMSACLALEKPIHVAYLGPKGTFTQEAALKHFGHSAKTHAKSLIDEVFREVEAGSVNYGVVPVENSTEGVVNHTLDNFIESNLKICGEVELRVHQNLLVSDVTKTDSITRIYSHSQSLAQCRKWLDANYPNAERIAVNSNAEAAKRIQGEWHSAAIAGELAAQQYDLSILAPRIEDQPDNSTRFLIIGTENVPASGQDKTSIVVSTRNQPGALHDLLAPFNKYDVDLTRVETRPSHTGPWNYVFFIDFLGHQSDDMVQKALKAVASQVVDLKVLGSYPQAVL